MYLLPSSSLSPWTQDDTSSSSSSSSEEEDEDEVTEVKVKHQGDEVYSFDGATTAIEVPASKVNHSLGDHFTLSLWMKHDSPSLTSDINEAKEHIMCNADGDGMTLVLIITSIIIVSTLT